VKKFFLALAIVVSLVSCADKKTINGIEYRPYGFLNESTAKNDSVQYALSGWAVASGVVFFELVVPPIYTFGFNLWQPIGLKSEIKAKNLKGVVND